MAETRNHSQGLYPGPRPRLPRSLNICYCMEEKNFLLRIVKRKKEPRKQWPIIRKKEKPCFMPASFLTNQTNKKKEIMWMAKLFISIFQKHVIIYGDNPGEFH